MNRAALLGLVVLLPLTMLLLGVAPRQAEGADVVTQVSFNRDKQGTVYIVSTISLDDAKKLDAVTDPRIKNCLLVRELLSPPRELSDRLIRDGFSNVNVKQQTKGFLQTEVNALTSDARPLTACGGELKLSLQQPGNYLELNGKVGGLLAGEKDVDLSAVKDITVKLWIFFPGTIREADPAGRIAHDNRSITYLWTANRLLGGDTKIHVRIVPDVESNTYFWLALILVVTSLVVLGAFIVLRHGRQAALPGGK